MAESTYAGSELLPEDVLIVAEEPVQRELSVVFANIGISVLRAYTASEAVAFLANTSREEGDRILRGVFIDRRVPPQDTPPVIAEIANAQAQGLENLALVTNGVLESANRVSNVLSLKGLDEEQWPARLATFFTVDIGGTD